jgi:tRNA dimethylallyltransferase
MLPAPFTNALVLTGPTASGKTGLAMELAQRLGAEIISMDSMALYRHMDIGTAKPTPEQRQLVAHHLIDVLDPTESASVAWWLQRAELCCREIESRGKQVLFVGGTPLYLKALMFGLFAGPAADLDLRHRLSEEARQFGPATLHERLARVDPVAAERIHANDVRRIIRALEVFELTGQRISDWQQEWRANEGPPSPTGALPPLTREARAREARSPISLWLDWPRTELYERINRRVVEMFDGGLVEEALALRRLGRPLSKEASQAVGYAEVFAHIDGLCTRQEAIERVQIRSRQFAKRQITWFRHLPGCLPTTSELTWKLWQPKMRE